MFNRFLTANRTRTTLDTAQHTGLRESFFDIAYRLPMAMGRRLDRAHVTFWFRFERYVGPYTEGRMLHAAWLPPGGIVRMTPTDRQTCFLLETDSTSALRTQTNASERVYMARLSKALQELALADPAAHTVTLDETQHVFQVETREPGDRPLSSIVRRFLQVTESCSRLAESIARTPPADGLPAEKWPGLEGLPRIFANPSRMRGLTLFLYHLSQYYTARLTLTRIERDALPDEVALADLDRRLQAAGLIDTQGNVAPGVQAQWGWQRNFALPTPHILVKTCPEDLNNTELVASREIKIDVWQYPGQIV